MCHCYGPIFRWKQAPVIATNLSKFWRIVTAFYENFFAPSKDILTKIEQAVSNDKAVIIVALCLHSTAKVDQMFCTYTKKLNVVAAVSYQTYPNPTNALLATDVFFIYGCCKFCIATLITDSFLASEWKQDIPVCPGYQMLRKYESKCQTDCVHFTMPRSFVVAFYNMIGFHKINLHSKDEFDLLPMHMQI
jgi:hypothetical protein